MEYSSDHGPRPPRAASEGNEDTVPLPRDAHATAQLTTQRQQAEKTLQSAGSGFSFFGGREEKYQNAADAFIEAANAFKMQGQSKEPPPVGMRPRD